MDLECYALLVVELGVRLKILFLEFHQEPSVISLVLITQALLLMEIKVAEALTAVWAFNYFLMLTHHP